MSSAALASAAPRPGGPRDVGPASVAGEERGAEPAQKTVKNKGPSRNAGNPEQATAPPDASRLPAFLSIATEAPLLPRPGSIRDPLTLPDEILTAYAEEYQSYAAPWKHLVGVEIPNFFQFVVWHERIMPAGRTAPMQSH